MQKFILPFLAAGAALAPAPAAAQAHPAPYTQHRDPTATLLRARIASLNARIDRLRDRDAIGRDEARELREEARRLQLRLYGMSRRDAGDVELGIARIESRITFAADDTRSLDFEDRFDDGDRYERQRYELERPNYSRSGAYTGSSVDRW